MLSRRAQVTDDQAFVLRLGLAASILLGLGSAGGVLIAYFFSAPPNEGGYMTTDEATGVAILAVEGVLFGAYGAVAAYRRRGGTTGMSLVVSGACVIAWWAQASAHAADDNPGASGHDAGIGIVAPTMVTLGLVCIVLDVVLALGHEER